MYNFVLHLSLYWFFSLCPTFITSSQKPSRLASKEDAPVVVTKFGNVQGAVATSRLKKPYYQYLGIPFAEPPVDNLRFEPPQPFQGRWEGTRRFVEYANDCLQFDAILTGKTTGSEDCLYLNVYTPSVFPSSPMPVLVWVYGGLFVSGTTKLYNPKYLMDENVVVVSMNYRLGVLGFLNTGDNMVRGNMGLKDQNMALQFVRDNIANFGGDPNRMTLFGESAGAASVHYHVISPLSTNLFHRAIMQSGNVFCPWAFTKNPYRQAVEFGNAVRCPTWSTYALVNCLKKMPGRDIVEQHQQLLSPIHTQNDVFAPSAEPVFSRDSFLRFNPIVLVQQGNFNKVPVIFGMNSGEGALKTARFEANPSIRYTLDEKWNEYIPILLHYNPAWINVSSSLRSYYFPKSVRGNRFPVGGLNRPPFLDFDHPERNNYVDLDHPMAIETKAEFEPPEYNLDNITRMVSDGIWFHATSQAAKYHSQYALTYLNYFSYQSKSIPLAYILLKSAHLRRGTPAQFFWPLDILENEVFSQSPKRFGACHTDDLFYYWRMNPDTELLDAIFKPGNIFSQTALKAVKDTISNVENLVLDKGPKSVEFLDYHFSRDFVKSLTDFARNESPLAFQKVPWEPVNKEASVLRYMNIMRNGKMIDQPHASEVAYIDSLNIRNTWDPNNW